MRIALITSLAVLSCGSLFAQDKGGMEEFKEVDPYTKGDKEKVAALGYVRVGSFLWEGSERTEHVQETMGGLDVLWVETEHFRIGSSLGTYRIPNDRQEKAKLKAEFKTLKSKLKKFKPPRRTLDPWLRLHLYAQRAEQIHDEFAADFGLDDQDHKGDEADSGPPKKALLLLCERQSELGRYLRAYLNATNDFAYRTGSPDRPMFFGINLEIIERGYEDKTVEPFDSMLHCLVAQGLSQNLVDGHQQKLFVSPEWFSAGVGHVYARRVDPRWVQTGAVTRSMDSEHWKWDERVTSLVKNDFFAKMPEMFGWVRGREWNERDHMVIWSKVEFMIGLRGGDAGAFLSHLVVPVPEMTVGERDELEKRQTLALEACFDLTPETFDSKWKKWVKGR